MILVNIFAKHVYPVGEIFSTLNTWQRKDGTRIRVQLRHQVFYNKDTQVGSLNHSC